MIIKLCQRLDLIIWYPIYNKHLTNDIQVSYINSMCNMGDHLYTHCGG